VRYINAVPDTGLLDFKFVDKVEGSAWYGLMQFRDVSNYQTVDAGTRHIKVFNGANNTPMNEPSYVTAVHVDTTLTFEANKYYTVMHIGNARGKASRLWLIEDARPNVAAGQIAVRAINAASSVGSVDIYTAAATGGAVSGTPLFPNVAYAAVTAYQGRTTGALAFQAANAGTTTKVAESLAPTGAAAASSSQSQQGGYSIGGSMLTAFVFPRSVAGSPAPQTAAFQNPAVVWLQDNRP